jgi:hypothetical protein
VEASKEGMLVTLTHPFFQNSAGLVKFFQFSRLSDDIAVTIVTFANPAAWARSVVSGPEE